MIRILPPAIAAQIAAGEVVERPASVIKELVENAIDAGATTITVEIRGGGITEMIIRDDGSGIPADQIEVAFARHATSKLSKAEDLFAIQTLGFRGEALPSIAAVAQVSCTSRTKDSDRAVELRIAGSEIQDTRFVGAPVGTTFLIRNLFYNLPVRREFLRSPGAETAAISAVMTHYALAYPHIRFTLAVDGKPRLASSGTGNIKDVMLAVYGTDVVSHLVPIDFARGEGLFQIAINGLISDPTISRNSREAMHISVNGRAIAPRGQLAAIFDEAYHTLLMKGRFPYVVVAITVDPAAVDVNVHPTKSEVKFRDPDYVRDNLASAMRHILQQIPAIQDGASPLPSRRQRAHHPHHIPAVKRVLNTCATSTDRKHHGHRSVNDRSFQKHPHRYPSNPVSTLHRALPHWQIPMHRQQAQPWLGWWHNSVPARVDHSPNCASLVSWQGFISWPKAPIKSSILSTSMPLMSASTTND